MSSETGDLQLTATIAPSVVPGCWVAWATVPDIPSPIGTAYLLSVDRFTLGLQDCYVIHFLRRRGVLRFLLSEAFRQFPDVLRITTESAATPGVERCLRRLGWWRTPDRTWILPRSDFQQQQRKIKPTGTEL